MITSQAKLQARLFTHKRQHLNITGLVVIDKSVTAVRASANRRS